MIGINVPKERLLASVCTRRDFGYKLRLRCQIFRPKEQPNVVNFIFNFLLLTLFMMFNKRNHTH